MASQRQKQSRDFAADQCRLYREQFDYGECQVSHLLRKSEEFRRWESQHCLPGLEVHHLYGRRRLECSHFTALILVENAAHDFAHDAACRAFNAGHAMEVCCLTEKHRQYAAEIEQPDERQYASLLNWHLPTLEMICSYSTFAYRLEMLADSLCKSPYAGLAENLLEHVS